MRGQRGEAEVGELEDLVVQGERADVDGDVAAREVGGALTAVLQGLPGHLQQFALLGVHVVGLARTDAEELGVELVESVDVSAAAADEPSRLVPVAAAERGDVVAVGGCGRDAVLALHQVPPERPVVRGPAGQAAAHADDRHLAP
ncbi:hypothetical protein GCM10020227_03850 [Streptomyces flavovirens]